MYFYIIALMVFLMDQITKWLVVNRMEIEQTIPIIEGVFHITSHRNRGAAFGILQDQRWFFVIVTLVVVVGIIYYIQRIAEKRSLLFYSLALILGGAVGNFLDRLLTGAVVDFFDFRLINYPIFNVADAAIVVGVALYLLHTLLEMKQERRD